MMVQYAVVVILCVIFVPDYRQLYLMISVFAYQLPFSVCLLWFLIVVVRKRNCHTDRLLAVVMGLLAVGFYCGANNLSFNPDFRRQVIMNTILECTSLAALIMVCFYIRSLADDFYKRSLSYVMLLPVILHTTVNVVLLWLLGVDDAAVLFSGLFHGLIGPDSMDKLQSAFLLVSYVIYRALFLTILVQAIMFMVFWLVHNKFRPGHVWAFIKGGRTSFTSNIVCILFIIYFILWAVCILFNRLFLDIHSPWSVIWSVAVALVLFLVGYVATVPSLPGGYMTMERLRHPFTAIRQTPEEYLSTIDSGPLATSDAPQSGYDKIMDSFRELMETNQGFLNPDMTIDMVSEQLATNRTYVSKLVNIYYGMPFRDYLSKMRMDFAKQLMQDEPDAPIEYIAAKSGFQSSTQFIRKFKELENTTPAAWRNAQLHKTN